MLSFTEETLHYRPPEPDVDLGPLGVFLWEVNYVPDPVEPEIGSSVPLDLFVAQGGDGNGDGRVDTVDITNLVANFGTKPDLNTWLDNDTAGGTTGRGDGKVDTLNITDLVANFDPPSPDPGPVGSGDLWLGQESPPATYPLPFRLDPLGEGRTAAAISNVQFDSFIVIPEPSTVALAVIGVLMLLTYARWKRRPAWTRLPQLPQ